MACHHVLKAPAVPVIHHPQTASKTPFADHRAKVMLKHKCSERDMVFVDMCFNRLNCSGRNIQILLDFGINGITFKRYQEVVLVKQSLLEIDGWKTKNLTSSYFDMEPLILVYRDPLDLIISQWRAGLSKGDGFIEQPAKVFFGNERRYGHPLSGDWAIAVHQLINADATIKAHAAAAGIAESQVLAFSCFSDKTKVGNNLSCYPMQIAQMHSNAKDIHAIFASGRGITAYIPIAHKPAEATSEEHTERMCKLLADALNEILASLKQASTEGVVVQANGKLYHLVPAILSYLHDNPEGRDLLCLWTNNQAKQMCALCYVDGKVCGKYPAPPSPPKYMCEVENIRKKIRDLMEHHKQPDYHKITKALELARDHGARECSSGLVGLGLQPTEADILQKRLICINSVFSCFYPDIMHVFPGGVWKRVLAWCLQGIPHKKDIVDKATLNLKAIKRSTSSTFLHLPRVDYLVNQGDLMNSEHKAIMQVVLPMFAGTTLEETRMTVLRLTVELYMLLTNRNMNQWHTDKSIEVLEAKLELWTKMVLRMFSVMVGSAGYNIHMPKVHDLRHIIEMIKLRGIPQFHSCEGGEAGHKRVAKLPGRNTNRHQDTFGLQVSGEIRLLTFYKTVAVEISGTGTNAVGFGPDLKSNANRYARAMTVQLRTINFLAGAETVNISPRLPQFLPKSKISHVRRLMEDTQGALDVLSVPQRLARLTGSVYSTPLRVKISARAYLMGERVMSAPGTELSPELNSLIASPSFYRTAQYSDVMFKQTVGSGTDRVVVYKLGQVRVMFSLVAKPPVPGRPASATARLPVPYALVHLYDRHRLTLTLAAPTELQPNTARYGASIAEWRPTLGEESVGTGCVSLRKLPAWGTMVIPLSWVVQAVHVVPDGSTADPSRFLLNRWHWNKLA